MSNRADFLGFLYQGTMEFRNWCYDSGRLSIEKLDAPVVSIGNLTAGGTGKTPIVADLVSWTLSLKLPVGIISRGYRGKFEGVQRVSSDPLATPIWGDEPTMLARKFPDVPVYVHANRVLAGQALLADSSVKWILADDAFQHRRLHRDLDIVVFDLSAPVKQLRSLPFGRAREPLKSLSRANFIILNKENLASKENREAWRWELREWMNPGSLIEVSCEIEGVFSLNSPSVGLADPEQVWLVSGIGHPQSYEFLMRSNGFRVMGHSVFPDHHDYNEKDEARILADMKAAKVDRLVATSKDMIKLRQFNRLRDVLFEARLTLAWGHGRENLDKEILRLVR
ncbi:MAG: tetraacyldisaccharide 4'-kinase [Bdellovibrionales bacterium]|nr:tetraacyldisaccharide 4'-kinase [Bdellovibrionales bacterium]